MYKGDEVESLADSLGGGIGLHNAYTFDIVRELVDDYILLSEEQIAAGMRHLYQHERVIAEGAGAAPVAAADPGAGARTMCICRGTVHR